MNHYRHYRLIHVFVFAVTVVISAVAQSSGGQVEGTVSDAQQAVLPQTSVELADGQGHVLQRTVTDLVGHFAFHAIPSGIYSLHIVHSGFSPVDRSTVVVAGQPLTHIDVALVTENVSQTVTVNGGQDPLTTASSTGTRLGLEPLETPAAISILNSEVLEARGYNQIEEAVRSMPGALLRWITSRPFAVRGSWICGGSGDARA